MTYWAPYAGRVYDENEVNILIESAKKFWLTHGEYTTRFERMLSEFTDLIYVHATNSGSSANLLAISALTSPLLTNRLQKGDEIITTAANFPTTVAPILQNGLKPVFVDIKLGTYNVDVEHLEKAISRNTKAMFLAHTLGTPFDIEAVKFLCSKYNLWLIEDCCDALGSQYRYKDEWKQVGTVGDMATFSFYPAHLITTGEGGAVATNNALFSKILQSLRDWGRDCYCPTGEDNTCGKRFEGKYGTMPQGYDHKYIYSHFGYNLKMTDLQGAIGCAQMDKITSFIQKRIDNWDRMYASLEDLSEYFILPIKVGKPCPFGFMMTLTPFEDITRNKFQKWLDEQGIQSRLLFAGNILRQPCFQHLREDRDYRARNLDTTDYVMENGIWVGVYPGLDSEKIDKMCKYIETYFTKE